MTASNLRIPTCRRRTTIFALIVVMVVGATLRLWALGASSLWMDEALSWRLQSFPVMQLISRTAEPATCHPPFYFLLLKGWTTAWGDSDVVLRLLSCLVGVLLIPVMYAWGSELCQWVPPQLNGSDRAPLVGLAAAAIVACNPLQVHLSQQVRGYSLASLLAAASGCILLKALRASRLESALWLGWAATAVLLCYTHNLGPVTVAAEVLFAVRVCWLQFVAMSPNADGVAPSLRSSPLGSRRFLMPLLAAMLVAIAYVPWLTHAAAQADTLGGSFRNDLTLETVQATFYGAFIEGSDTPGTSSILRIGAILLVAVLHLTVWLKGGTAGLFLLLWSLVPVYLLLFFSLISSRSIFLTRYLFVAQLGWILMAALVPFLFRKAHFQALAVAMMITLVTAHATVTIAQLNRPRPPGMRGAADYLREHVKPGESILALSPQIFLTAKPYLPGDGELRLLSMTCDRTTHSGSPLLLDTDLVLPEWPRESGDRSFWLIRSQSYRVLAKEDWETLETATIRSFRRIGVTEWPQENRWEQPIVVEHYLQSSTTGDHATID